MNKDRKLDDSQLSKIAGAGENSEVLPNPDRPAAERAGNPGFNPSPGPGASGTTPEADGNSGPGNKKLV